MVGRITRTPRRRGKSAVRQTGLETQHGRLLQLIDDIDVAVRGRKLERIAELLKLLRTTAEAQVREQRALLRDVRTRGRDLQDWGASEPSAARFPGLTSRERQVLELVVKGNSNKAIAKFLGIGQRTVETHRAGVMKKIGARSLPELIHLAIVGPSGDKS